MKSDYTKMNKVISTLTALTFFVSNFILLDTRGVFAEEQKKPVFATANLQTTGFSATDVLNRQTGATINVANLNSVSQAAFVGPVALTPTSSSAATSSARAYLSASDAQATGYVVANISDTSIGYEINYLKDGSGNIVLNNQGLKMVAGVNEYDIPSGKLTKQTTYTTDIQKRPCQVISSVSFVDKNTGIVYHRDSYQWDSASNRSVMTTATDYDRVTGNQIKMTRFAFDNSTLPSKAIFTGGQQAISEIYEYDPNVANQATKRTRYQISNTAKVDASGSQLLYSVEEWTKGVLYCMTYYRSGTNLVSSMQYYQADGKNLSSMMSFDSNGVLYRAMYFEAGTGKMKSSIELDQAKNVLRLKSYDPSTGSLLNTYEYPLSSLDNSWTLDGIAEFQVIAQRDNLATVSYGSTQTCGQDGATGKKICQSSFNINGASLGYSPFNDVLVRVMNSDSFTYDSASGLVNGFLYPSSKVKIDADNNFHISLTISQLQFSRVEYPDLIQSYATLVELDQRWDVVIDPTGRLISSTFVNPYYGPSFTKATITKYYGSDGKVKEQFLSTAGTSTINISYYDEAGVLAKTENYYDTNGRKDYRLRYIVDEKTHQTQSTNLPSKRIYYDNRTINDHNINRTFVVFEESKTLSNGDIQKIGRIYDSNHQLHDYQITITDSLGQTKSVEKYDLSSGKVVSKDYYSVSTQNGQVVAAHEDFDPTSGILINRVKYSYFPLSNNIRTQLIQTESFVVINPGGIIVKDSAGKEMLSRVNEYAPPSEDPATRSQLPHHLAKTTIYNPNSSSIKTIEEFNNYAFGANSTITWYRSSLNVFEYDPVTGKLKAQNEMLLDSSGNIRKDANGKEMFKRRSLFNEQGQKYQVIVYAQNVTGPIIDVTSGIPSFTAAYSESLYNVDASGNAKANAYQTTLYDSNGNKLQVVTFDETNEKPIRSQMYDARTGLVTKTTDFNIDRNMNPQGAIVVASALDKDSSLANLRTKPYFIPAAINLSNYPGAYLDTRYDIDAQGVKHIASKTLFTADDKMIQQVIYDKITGNAIQSTIYNLTNNLIKQDAFFDGLSGAPTLVKNFDYDPTKYGEWRLVSFTVFEGRLSYIATNGNQVVIPAFVYGYSRKDISDEFFGGLLDAFQVVSGKVNFKNLSTYDNPLVSSGVTHTFAWFQGSQGQLTKLQIQDTSFRDIHVSTYDNSAQLIKRTDTTYPTVTERKRREETDFITSKKAAVYLYKEIRQFDEYGNLNRRMTYSYDNLGEVINISTYDNKGVLVQRQPLNHHNAGTYYVYDDTGKELYKWVVKSTNLPTWSHTEEKWDLTSNGQYILTKKREFNGEDLVTREVTYDSKGRIIEEITYGSTGVSGEKTKYDFSSSNVLTKKTIKSFYDVTETVIREEIYDPSTGKIQSARQLVDNKYRTEVYDYIDYKLAKKTIKDDSGKVIQLDEYDSSERLLKSTAYDLSGQVTSTDEYNYSNTQGVKYHVYKGYYQGKVKQIIEWDSLGSSDRTITNLKSDGLTYDFQEKIVNGSRVSKTTFYSNNKPYQVEEYLPNGSLKDRLVYSYYASGNVSRIDMYDSTGSLTRSFEYQEDGTEIDPNAPTMKPMSININGLSGSIDEQGKATLSYGGTVTQAQVNMQTMMLSADFGYVVISMQLKAKANGDMYCYSYAQRSSNSQRVSIRTSTYREDGLITSFIHTEGVDAFNQSVTKAKAYYSYDSQNRVVSQVSTQLVTGTRYNKAFSEWQASYTTTDWVNNTKTVVENIVVPNDFLTQINSTADLSKIDAFTYVKHEDKYDSNSWLNRISRTEWVKTSASATTFTKKAIIRGSQLYLIMNHSAGFSYELLSKLPSAVEGYTIRFGEGWQLDSDGNKKTYLGYGFVFEKTPIGAYFPSEIISADYPTTTSVMLSKESNGNKVSYTLEERSDGLYLKAPNAGDPNNTGQLPVTMSSYAQIAYNNANISVSIGNLPKNVTVSLRVRDSAGKYNQQFYMQPNGSNMYNQVGYVAYVNNLANGNYSYTIELLDSTSRVIPGASSQGNFYINYNRPQICNGSIVNGICIEGKTTTGTGGNGTTTKNNIVYR